MIACVELYGDLMDSIAEYEKQGIKLRDVTLCYLVSGNKVLIAMKKRGFGQGKLNGVGGKAKEGESIEQAMLRETAEEIGVRLKSYRKAGTIDFYFTVSSEDKDWNQRVHVFIADKWEGEPSESEEMKPEWVDKDKIPLDRMWPDDRYWLAKALGGKRIRAAFLFDGDENIIDHYVVEQDSINISDFAKVDLRVGKVLEVNDLATKKPMYALLVDLGELGKRNIAAGIKDKYSKEELLGKRIIVVSNLEPKSIGGMFISEGMVLAAEDGDTLSLLSPERNIKEGSRIR